MRIPRALTAGLALLLAACEAPTATDDQACEATSQTGGYAGPLYETHAHLEGRENIGGFVCMMRSQGVETAVAFVTVDPSDPSGSERTLRGRLGAHPRRFVPFMVLDPKSPSDMHTSRIDAVLRGREALFRGIGEVGMYRNPWRTARLNDAPWPEVMTYAASKGVFLMLHPRDNQLPEFREAFASHRKTKFLIHGPEFPGEMGAVLRENPNVFYTLDTASFLSHSTLTPRPGGLQFGLSDQRSFIEMYDGHRDQMVTEAVAKWAPLIAAAPEQVMWGTDVAMDWHFEEEVFARLIDFSRRFIAALPAEHQAKFAHENARRILGEGVE